MHRGTRLVALALALPWISSVRAVARLVPSPWAMAVLDEMNQAQMPSRSLNAQTPSQSLVISHEQQAVADINEVAKTAKVKSKKDKVKTKKTSTASTGASETSADDAEDGPVNAGAMEALWDGKDLRDNRFSLNYLGKGAVAKATGVRNVHIFGMQHTGTDLLQAMLFLNFGFQLNYYGELPGNATANHKEGLWKHVNLEEEWTNNREEVDRVQSENISSIILTRNPFSWLQEVQDNSAEYVLCSTGADWLTKPCKMGGNKYAGVDVEYPDVESVWNRHMAAIANATQYGFSPNLIVSYEELVSHPEEILDQIGTLLGLSKPPYGWLALAEEVDGTSPSHDKALTKLRTMSYLSEFTTEQKLQVCERLDVDLLKQFNYSEICESLTTGELGEDES